MNKSYQAIILAAGSGHRMRPLTDDNHKTLLEINGESILSHIILQLLANDISAITLVLGYHTDKIKAHVEQRFPETRFNYVINEQYGTTNNLVSLSLALDSVEAQSDMIIVEADLIFEDGVLKRLLDADHENVALVDRYRFGMDGTVVSISGDQITHVIPPHLQDIHFSFDDKYKTLNMYKFSAAFCFGAFRALLAYYAPAMKNSYYELILGVIIYLRTEPVHAAVLEGEKWVEVDDPNDLQIARFMFEDNPKRILDQAYGGFWNYDVIDFCYLRNMHFPPDDLLAELKNNLGKTIHAYGSSQKILNRKMSYFLQCSEEYVTAVNGISQLFPIMRRFFRGQTVLHPTPTFGDYHRVFPDALHYADQVGIDLADIESTAADVVILVNPNNPTGSLVPSDWIFDFARNHPAKTMVVDESFIDFSDETSLIEQLKSEPLDNVIVITSLSKCLGVAGLRLGYCYTSHHGFLDVLREEIPIWNMNTVAENFLEILLKYRSEYRASLAAVKQDRQVFYDDLSTVPIVEKVYAGGGDYLLARLTIDRPTMDHMSDAFLEEHHMYLKSVSDKFNDGHAWMRFAVHRPSVNRRLVEHLHSFASKRAEQS